MIHINLFRRAFGENHIIIHLSTRFEPTSVVHNSFFHAFRTNKCGSSSGQVKEPDHDCMLNREREDHPTTIFD